MELLFCVYCYKTNSDSYQLNPIWGGANTTFSGWGSDLPPNPTQTRQFSSKHGLFNSKFNSQQLLFSWQCRKITFWTTFVRPTYLYYSYIEWKGRGSDMTTFLNWVFRLPKVVQKFIFRCYELSKSYRKLIFEWSWAKKSF